MRQKKRRVNWKEPTIINSLSQKNNKKFTDSLILWNEFGHKLHADVLKKEY